LAVAVISGAHPVDDRPGFTNLQWFDTDSMHDLLIEGTAWDVVVLQDQSFRPLPAMITVNGKSVVTRGDFEGFESV
jgi:hypothetical protein